MKVLVVARPSLIQRSGKFSHLNVPVVVESTFVRQEFLGKKNLIPPARRSFLLSEK